LTFEVKLYNFFTFRVSHYMTTGIIEHQLKTATRESEKCFVSDISAVNNEIDPLFFNEYKGVNIVLLMGFAISFVTCCAELLINHINMFFHQIFSLYT